MPGAQMDMGHLDGGETENLRQAIADADRKINGYRATIDAGGDPALIAGWIAETAALKKAAQARLGLTEAPPQRMTADQLGAIAEAFSDLLGLLRNADPRDRAELYSRIGLRMTYQPGPETVIAEVRTPADVRVFDMCPEIDKNQYPIRANRRSRSDFRLADPLLRRTPPAERQSPRHVQRPPQTSTN